MNRTILMIFLSLFCLLAVVGSVSAVDDKIGISNFDCYVDSVHDTDVDDVEKYGRFIVQGGEIEDGVYPGATLLCKAKVRNLLSTSGDDEMKKVKVYYTVAEYRKCMKKMKLTNVEINNFKYNNNL